MESVVNLKVSFRDIPIKKEVRSILAQLEQQATRFAQRVIEGRDDEALTAARMVGIYGQQLSRSCQELKQEDIHMASLDLLRNAQELQGQVEGSPLSFRPPQ